MLGRILHQWLPVCVALLASATSGCSGSDDDESGGGSGGAGSVAHGPSSCSYPFTLDTVASSDNWFFDNDVLVDETGGVHVGFWNGSAQELTYAHRPPGGEWVSSVVDTIGGSNAFGIAPDGTVHFAYDNLPELGFVYSNSTDSMTWNREVLDSDSFGTFNAMAVDDSGNVHVVYNGPGSNIYALRAPDGTWTSEPFAPSGLWTPAIVVDSTGGVHVAFHPESSGVAYAYKPAGGDWQGAAIAAEGAVMGNRSMAVSDDGVVHFGVSDVDVREIAHIECSQSGSCTRSVIDAKGIEGPSIGVDASGGVHAAYYRRTKDNSRNVPTYAYRAPGADWKVGSIDVDLNGGSDINLHVEANGTVHVTFPDNEANSLRYATLPPGTDCL